MALSSCGLRVSLAAGALGVLLLANTPIGAGQGPGNPFRWFEPEVTVSAAERQRLDRDEVIVKMLPSRKGELAVFAATRINASPDVFVEWMRQIAALKRGPAITAVERFSDPPTLADLTGLVLDQRDLDAVRQCRRGDCRIKLSAEEIEAFRPLATERRPAVIEEAFRHMLLARLNSYRAEGFEATAATASRKDLPKPSDVFTALITNSPYVRRADPQLHAWLEGRAGTNGASVESFYYWAKEYYSAGKPVISLTQMAITRRQPGTDAPEVMVAGKQLYATRYMNGTLTVTSLVRDPASGSLYVVHLHRVQLDVLKGFFGGLARAIVQNRIGDGTPALLRELRAKVESGLPPPSR